jgi:hypothetical protein
MVQKQNTYRNLLAEKRRVKKKVWKMPPDTAQAFSCLVPSSSELQLVSTKAW